MGKVKFGYGYISRGKYRYEENENVFVKFKSAGKTYWRYGKIVSVSAPVYDGEDNSFRTFPLCIIENNCSVQLTDRNIIYIMHREPVGYSEEEINSLCSGKLVAANDENDFKYTDYERNKALQCKDECSEENAADAEEEEIPAEALGKDEE